MHVCTTTGQMYYVFDRHVTIIIITAKLGDFGSLKNSHKWLGGDHSLQLLWWPDTVLLKQGVT